jgi:hypothetical protein
MRSINKIFLAIACLALAALSCQALTGGGSGGGTPQATEGPQQGNVILEDDFSSDRWGIVLWNMQIMPCK